MATQWFYRVMGHEFGPCSAADIRSYASLGRIGDDAEIRKGSDGEWISARRVKGLFNEAPKLLAVDGVTAKQPMAQAVLVPRPTSSPPPLQVAPIASPPPLQAAPIAPTSVTRTSKTTKKRRWLSVLILIVTATGGYALLRGSKPSINPLQSLANSGLQSGLDRAIEFDHRNLGMDVSVYYRDTFAKSVVVFDLQNISGTNSRMDVFRLLLDFAEKMQGEYFETVILAFRGEEKFMLDGFYFRTLGRERNTQNPAYTIRTFPENLKTPTGLSAYPEWTGGLIGVLNKQMEDFNDFHDKWYLDDLTFSQ